MPSNHDTITPQEVKEALDQYLSDLDTAQAEIERLRVENSALRQWREMVLSSAAALPVEQEPAAGHPGRGRRRHDGLTPGSPEAAEADYQAYEDKAWLKGLIDNGTLDSWHLKGLGNTAEGECLWAVADRVGAKRCNSREDQIKELRQRYGKMRPGRRRPEM